MSAVVVSLAKSKIHHRSQSAVVVALATLYFLVTFVFAFRFLSGITFCRYNDRFLVQYKNVLQQAPAGRLDGWLTAAAATAPPVNCC